MTISRRSVLAASASAPLILGTKPAQAATASIQIHTHRHRGEIDRKIFGNFIEHLGRCITGGIFDEGSPLSDSRGFRKDVLAAVKVIKENGNHGSVRIDVDNSGVYNIHMSVKKKPAIAVKPT